MKSVHAKFKEDERLLLQQILEQAAASGEPASVDAKRSAGLVQRAYPAPSPPWLYEQPADEAKRAAYEMCRLLLLGLASRGSRAIEDDAESPARTKKKPARSR